MNLVFATHNANKAAEIQLLLPDHIKIQTLAQIGCDEDIPETGDTLEANALIKARYIYRNYQVNCFADDTGLEVEALNGKPGVYSARYAGEAKNAEANMNLLLTELASHQNRSAQFRTVIALIVDGQEYLFEGIIQGTIRSEKKGDQGFGYDPIFAPTKSKKTFAEMTTAEKNQLSHRARAIEKLVAFLRS